MTNLKEQFYQTKNIEFLKKTLGRELWVQVSGSKDINGASAAFWAALMPVENIDEAYRDYSWNSHIGTQCPGFIEYGGKITYEKAAGVFGLNTDNYVDVFDRILLQANAFILFLAKNFLKDWTVTLS